jgi:hypothetical protein
MRQHRSGCGPAAPRFPSGMPHCSAKAVLLDEAAFPAFLVDDHV